MATATATRTVPADDYAALNMQTLRSLAKTRGITVTAGVRKDQLVKVLVDSDPKPKPATAKPAKPSPVRTDVKPATAKPAKPSPVRTDVKPADVKPDPAETARKIAALENEAARLLGAAVTDSVKLAVTWARIYAFQPWKIHKATVKAYFEAHGMTRDNYIMPTDARHVLGALIWTGKLPADLQEKFGTYVDGATFTAIPNAPVDHVVAMSASSPRSVQRDRDALGVANTARQESHKKPAADKPKADKQTTTPAADGPVTRMVPVLSMISVREFISTLDDLDMLEELGDLVTERMTALGFKFAE
jgi:hypothetical protein